MDKQEAIERLKDLQTPLDREKAHREADAILKEFVDDEIVKEYDKIGKWYA